MQLPADIVTKAAEAAKLRDRRVWCHECGSSQTVEDGLRHGWPKCCGYTMSIDQPATK